MTTKDEIIEGIKSGKYDIEGLTIYTTGKELREDIIAGACDGLSKNKKAWFNLGECRNIDRMVLMSDGKPIKKIKIFFVVRKDEK